MALTKSRWMYTQRVLREPQAQQKPALLQISRKRKTSMKGLIFRCAQRQRPPWTTKFINPPQLADKTFERNYGDFSSGYYFWWFSLTALSRQYSNMTNILKQMFFRPPPIKLCWSLWNGEGCTSRASAFLQTWAEKEHPVMKCHVDGPGQAQKWPMKISGYLDFRAR